jgi:hypothetical protein
MRRAIACLTVAAALALALLPSSAAADPPAGCPAGMGLTRAFEHNASTPAGPGFFDLIHRLCA